MKNRKYLFRSQYKLYFFIVTNISSSLFIFFCHFFLYPNDKSICLFNLILCSYITWFLLNILFLFFFYYIFYFYEDKIVRIFVFRPFCREKIIKYNQISVIKFINVGGRSQFPRFIIHRKENKFFKSFFHAFYFKKRSKRVEVIKFLLSKNVVMDISISIPKKNKEIIEMVKEKYPNNVFINPDPHYWYKPIGYK